MESSHVCRTEDVESPRQVSACLEVALIGFERYPAVSGLASSNNASGKYTVLDLLKLGCTSIAT